MDMYQQSHDKINRELFVGNTPPGTSELLLMHFFNAALRRVRLCAPNDTPVLNSRVNSKFAFVELASAEMANRALQLNGIPFLGGTLLKVSRPSKYMGPPDPPHKSWQELTGQNLPDGAYLDAEQEKIRRELFIGNTTPEMTEGMLKEFLGNALQQVGLAMGPGNPINTCRVSGKFAFIELRTAAEAAQALNLNNIPFLGTALRVGRPSKYTGPADVHGNWEDILAKYMSGELLLPNSPQMQPTVTNTSRVVQLKNMLSPQDLEDPEEYEDIMQDTREECSKFGNLLQVMIPRKGEVGATQIFLEYGTSEEANAAILGLRGRTFDGRSVEATFFDEGKFAARDFSS